MRDTSLNSGCLVVALGGNALGNNPLEQKEIVKKTAKVIVDVASAGQGVVICHGNGPQVGMINLGFTVANQVSNGKIPYLPLPEAGSMSQGYIGFHLQNAILNELKKRQIDLQVSTIITQVLVDKNDVAFTNPTKPIGSFYTETEAKSLAQKYDWTVANDANRGWRRFVPSPKPKQILEKQIIQDLLGRNCIVIAGGGGGIPVYQENDQYLPVPAVIDKDWTAAKLANELKASQFMILTAVDYVSINYGKANETILKEVNINQLKKYCQAKQFGVGSMEPKIKAAISFIENNPHKKVIITGLDNCLDALQGKTGTIISHN